MATEISVLAVTSNPSLVIGLTFSGRGFDIDSTFELSGPVTADVLVVDTADVEASIAAISRLGPGRPPVVLITDRAIDSLPDRVHLCLRPYTLDALGDEIEAVLQEPVEAAPSPTPRAPVAPSRRYTPRNAPSRIDPPRVATPPPPPPEPEVVEPEALDPEVRDPETTEPEDLEPTIVEPDVGEPDVGEPDVSEPDVMGPNPVESEVFEKEVSESTEPEFVEPEWPDDAGDEDSEADDEPYAKLPAFSHEPASSADSSEDVEQSAEDDAQAGERHEERELLFTSSENASPTEVPPAPPPPPPAPPTTPYLVPPPEDEGRDEDRGDRAFDDAAEPTPESERHLRSVDATPALFGVPPAPQTIDEPEGESADEPEDTSTAELPAEVDTPDDDQAERELEANTDLDDESRDAVRGHAETSDEQDERPEPGTPRAKKRSWLSFLAPKPIEPDPREQAPSEPAEPVDAEPVERDVVEPQPESEGAEPAPIEPEFVEPQSVEPAAVESEPSDPAPVESVAGDSWPSPSSHDDASADTGHLDVDEFDHSGSDETDSLDRSHHEDADDESEGGLVYQDGRWQRRFVEPDEGLSEEVAEEPSSAEEDAATIAGGSSAEHDEVTAAHASSAEDDETMPADTSSAEDDWITVADVSSAEDESVKGAAPHEAVVDDLFSEPERDFALDSPADERVADEGERQQEVDAEDDLVDDDAAIEEDDVIDLDMDSEGADVDTPAPEATREPLRSVQPPAPPAQTVATAPRAPAPAGRGAFRRFSRRPVELSEREADMRTRLASVLMAASELERVVGDLPVIADHSELCAAIVGEVRATFDADTAAYYLQRDEGWHVIAGHGLTRHQTTSVVTSDQPMLSEVHASGGGLLIDPVEAVPAAVVGIAGAHTESVMAASVSVGPGRYGLLFVGRNAPLTEADLDRLVALATEAAPGVAVSELIARIGGLVDKG